LVHYEHQFVGALFSHGFLRFICGLVQASVFLEVLVSNQGAKGGKGQAIGVAAVPLNKLNGDQNLQPSSLWNLVRQTLRQVPVSTWPAVKRKAFSLVPPHKMVKS
jgi:vacuolar protein sorting-associated protein 13A/C